RQRHHPRRLQNRAVRGGGHPRTTSMDPARLGRGAAPRAPGTGAGGCRAAAPGRADAKRRGAAAMVEGEDDFLLRSGGFSRGRCVAADSVDEGFRAGCEGAVQRSGLSGGLTLLASLKHFAEKNKKMALDYDRLMSLKDEGME